MDVQDILLLLAQAAEAASGFIPQGALVGELAGTFERFMRQEQERTGKTREQILEHAGITLSEVQAKALADYAAGL